MYKRSLVKISLLLLLLAGCTTTKEIIKEVPVETIREVEKKVFVHDSIYMHDSTFIYQKGDTVFENVWHTKYIEKQIHDTLRTHDTIPQIINTETTVVKTVNKPQWWPVWLLLGIILLYFLITKTKFIDWVKTFIKIILKIFK